MRGRDMGTLLIGTELTSVPSLTTTAFPIPQGCGSRSGGGSRRGGDEEDWVQWVQPAVSLLLRLPLLTLCRNWGMPSCCPRQHARQRVSDVHAMSAPRHGNVPLLSSYFSPFFLCLSFLRQSSVARMHHTVIVWDMRLSLLSQHGTLSLCVLSLIWIHCGRVVDDEDNKQTNLSKGVCWLTFTRLLQFELQKIRGRRATDIFLLGKARSRFPSTLAL